MSDTEHDREPSWTCRRLRAGRRPRGPRRAGHRARSCSRRRPTASATSRTPTSTRSRSACPARCRCSTARPSSWRCGIGLALNCTVQPLRRSHRKNYFYPDMPKAYQISQYDQPLNVDGWLDLPDGTRVGIERAHLEEDTGKSTHVGGTGGRIHGSDYSLIDFNRAGVPLVEIVSRPDIRTPEQATPVRQRAAGDPRGHRRLRRQDGGGLDARRRQRQRPPARRAVRHPLRDQERQLGALARPGHRVRGAAPDRPARERASRSARRPATGTRTTAARTRCARKEDADDYRYFLEPDLVPLDPDAEWIERVRALAAGAARPRAAPRSPRRPVAAPTPRRCSSSSSAARTTTCSPSSRPAATPARALVHVKQSLRRRGRRPPVPAADLAALTRLEVDGALTATQAKQVLAEIVVDGGGDAAAIAAAQGLRGDGHVARSRRWSTTAIAAEPDAWAKYCAGEDKALGALVGAVMKATQGPGRRQGRHRPAGTLAAAADAS